MEQTFTKENIENLSQTCKKITSLLDENTDSSFMAVQLVCLGDRIKDFMKNPIVRNSGLVKYIKEYETT
jgi:hypothetical protein